MARTYALIPVAPEGDHVATLGSVFILPICPEGHGVRRLCLPRGAVDEALERVGDGARTGGRRESPSRTREDARRLRVLAQHQRGWSRHQMLQRLVATLVDGSPGIPAGIITRASAAA
jgi:hypothetical protein